MSDLRDRHSSQVDPLDVDTGETARIVIKERPEVAACLDGLVFRGQEDAIIPLLRAALVNMASNVLLDIEDEDAISACSADLKVQTDRMKLAAMALDWEVQAGKRSKASLRQRSTGYQAEICELLQGPLPPLELVNRQEQDVVVRKVKESLERETQVGEAGAAERMEELRAILEDIGGEEAGSFPCFITRLRRPRLAEWLARWSDEAYKETQAERGATPVDLSFGQGVTTEVSLLREIERRLQPPGNQEKSFAASACQPVIPRNGS
jgi:hypothetical protein